MYGASAGTFGRTPWDRGIQRPVYFECTGTVAKTGQRGTKGRREAVAAERQHLARRYVAHHERHIRRRSHRREGQDLAAEGAEVGSQRVGNALRAAAGKGPT